MDRPSGTARARFGDCSRRSRRPAASAGRTRPPRRRAGRGPAARGRRRTAATGSAGRRSGSAGRGHRHRTPSTAGRCPASHRRAHPLFHPSLRYGRGWLSEIRADLDAAGHEYQRRQSGHSPPCDHSICICRPGPVTKHPRLFCSAPRRKSTKAHRSRGNRANVNWEFYGGLRSQTMKGDAIGTHAEAARPSDCAASISLPGRRWACWRPSSPMRRRARSIPHETPRSARLRCAIPGEDARVSLTPQPCCRTCCGGKNATHSRRGAEGQGQGPWRLMPSPKSETLETRELMTDQQLKFAEGFPMPTYEQWVAEVEKALKGAPFDKRMYTKTYEGMTLRPIYTRQDWPSARIRRAFRRLCRSPRRRAAGNRVDNWDVRQAYACGSGQVQRHHPQRARARRHVTAPPLRPGGARRPRCGPTWRRCARRRRRGGLFGRRSRPAVDRRLPRSRYRLARRRRAGRGGGGDAGGLWHRRRLGPDAAKGAFNADPLGALAATGTLPVAIDAALAQMADLARHAAPPIGMSPPSASILRRITTPAQPESQDLAASMATAVAYLKAMTAAGLDIDQACRRILFYLFGSLRSVPRHRQAARRPQDVGTRRRGLRCDGAGAGDEAERRHRLADDEQA